MSSIWLTVEFSPGSDIADACRDAVALANKTGVAIHGKFNGVLLMAAPGDRADDLCKSWHQQMDDKRSTYKIATAHRGAQL
jgi:hypothetical protein